MLSILDSDVALKEAIVFTRLRAVLPAMCLATGLATAQSPFIGAWKLDPAKSSLPDEMKITRNGGNKYTFDFGGTPEPITVDGSYQPGVDSTLLSVKATGPNTWIVQRKNKDRQLMLTATWRLSNHDSTLNDAFRGHSPDGSAQDIDYVYQRIGAGSGIVADWRSVKETVVSPFALKVTAFQGKGLTFASPLVTRNATFEDKNRPDGPGGPSSMRRVGDRKLVMTIKQGAKTVATQDIELSPDQKGLTMTIHVVGNDRPIVLSYKRQ